MIEQWVRDFNEKGFVVLHEPELVELLDIDSFQMKYTEEMLRDNTIEDLPAHINKQLELIAHTLKTKYIDEMFEESSFVKYILWEGVDADSAAWHNDGFEGMNAFFLLYLDDQNESTGGDVHFKWGDNEETIYPKRGDLVLLNQAPGFFHRAEKASILRRQASFDFVVT